MDHARKHNTAAGRHGAGRACARAAHLDSIPSASRHDSRRRIRHGTCTDAGVCARTFSRPIFAVHPRRRYRLFAVAMRSRAGEDPVRAIAQHAHRRKDGCARRHASDRGYCFLRFARRLWGTGLFRRRVHPADGYHSRSDRFRSVLFIHHPQSDLDLPAQHQHRGRRIRVLRKTRTHAPRRQYGDDTRHADRPAFHRLFDRLERRVGAGHRIGSSQTAQTRRDGPPAARLRDRTRCVLPRAFEIDRAQRNVRVE